MSGGLCELSRGLVWGREWGAGHRAGARRAQELTALRVSATRRHREVRCQGRRPGGTGTGSSASSSRCSTFPGTQRSQGASHTSLPRGAVSREWPGRDEHWLVRAIELVLDGPRKLDTLRGLDARHYRGVRCQRSRLGGTSTSSSTPQYPSTDSAGKAELVALDAGLDHRAGFEVAGEDALGQRVFDPALDRALERAGAVDRVVADGDEFFHRFAAQLQVEVAFGQTLTQTVELDVGDAGDLLLAQRFEHHHFVDPVDELRTEVLANGVHGRRPLCFDVT